VRLEDSLPVLAQSVDLGLLAITTAFSASSDNMLRSRPRPRIRPGGVLRQVELHPYRVGDLEKILGSGFETKIVRLHPREFSGRFGSGGAHPLLLLPRVRSVALRTTDAIAI